MSDCDNVRRLVAPYLDGELVDDERRLVEEHLASCSACRALFARESSLSSAVQDAVPRHEASAELRERVGSFAVRRGPRLGWMAAVAALLLGVVAGAIVWRLSARRPAAPASDLVAVAVDSYLRFSRGQLPLEVRSERPDEVSRWFEGRVPFHLALPDYPVGPGEKKFYRLEGGRLVALEGDYAAYVAYRMDDRPISLLVASATTVGPSGRDTVKWGGLTFHLESVAGLDVITWSDKGLTYALASELGLGGQRSCLVCHGSPKERSRIEGFSSRPPATSPQGE